MLDLVDECFPNAKWVARLDADDRFAEPSSLRALVQAGDQRGTLFVIGSNRLSVDVVTSNVKRDNLRITASGTLQYIDIGRDIVRLTASRFLDCAARLYAIGELGWSDHELARRRTPERQVEALSALPGFDTYYGELMRSLHPACALDTDKEVPIPEPSAHPDVTLLIKCCPQDASSAHLQVQHLVSELGMRARFAKRVLLIDPFEGPYLRQFAEGDLSALRVAASQLHQSGFIDEVWVAPTDPVERFHLKDNWFSSRTGYVMTGSSGLATTPCLSASTLGFIARLRQRGLGRFKTAILRDECEGLAQVIPLWFGGGGRGRFDNGLRVAQGWQRRFVGHALADCLLIGDDLIDWIADGL